MKKLIKKHIRKLIIILAIILLLVVLLIINNTKNKVIKITINNQEILWNQENGKLNIDLETLNSEYDTIISSSDKNIKVNGDKLESGMKNLGKVNISNDNKIIVTKGNKEIITINTLPENFPEYTIEGKSNTEGDYYITTYNKKVDDNHYIMKINNNGEVVYYKKVLLSFDFDKIVTEDGKIRYTYLEANKQQNEDMYSFYYSNLVVMDEQYNEIKRIKYDENLDLENHAYYYINDDEYILVTYDIEKVTNIPKELSEKDENEVIVTKIKRVKENQVMWEFNTSDYDKLYEYSTDYNDFNNSEIGWKDYSHLNSIKLDSNDGNIVASFRNLDAILKIDIDTGKLIWIMGGKGDKFNMTKEQLFYKQHCLSFDSKGYLYIFDNGNDNKETRIIKLKYDDETKKITEFESYSIGSLSEYMGSVQMLDETENIALICYGWNVNVIYSFEEKNLDNNETVMKFKFKKNRCLYKVNKRV